MDLTGLAAAFDSEATALIRTDRSNDAAWARILDVISTPVDTTGSGDPDEFEVPNVVPLDHPTFEGVTGETLASAVEAAGNVTPGYVLLADARSMSEATVGDELTLGYVDLSCADPEDAEAFSTFMGRTFRCVIPEVAAIEVNLSIANMDFHEFADYADEHGGVFRGFDPGD